MNNQLFHAHPLNTVLLYTFWSHSGPFLLGGQALKLTITSSCQDLTVELRSSLDDCLCFCDHEASDHSTLEKPDASFGCCSFGTGSTYHRFRKVTSECDVSDQGCCHCKAVWRSSTNTGCDLEKLPASLIHMPVRRTPAVFGRGNLRPPYRSSLPVSDPSISCLLRLVSRHP